MESVGKVERPEYNDPPSGLAGMGQSTCFYHGYPPLAGSSSVLVCNSGQLAITGVCRSNASLVSALKTQGSEK